MKRVRLSFERMKDADLELAALRIFGNMINNEHFQGLLPIVQQVGTLKKAFSDAVVKAHNRDLHKITLKNDLRQELIKEMKRLGKHVNLEAEGQTYQLLTTGFPVTKNIGYTYLGAVKGFVIMPGESSGEMILKVKRAIHARAYAFQHTPDPLTEASVWKTVYSTRCKEVIRNLKPGVKYWFRVQMMGSGNQVATSSVLPRYVLF
jgi:hypothetical protein